MIFEGVSELGIIRRDTGQHAVSNRLIAHVPAYWDTLPKSVGGITLSSVSDDEVRQLSSDELDEELEQGWTRRTDERDIRSVSAHRWPDVPVGQGAPTGLWQVTVAAMEFVRGGTTEADLRLAIHSAITEVPGVTAVSEGDREVWDVEGTPSGPELVSATAAVVDRFADQIRVAYHGG
jgi:hypothetical protein